MPVGFFGLPSVFDNCIHNTFLSDLGAWMHKKVLLSLVIFAAFSMCMAINFLRHLDVTI